MGWSIPHILNQRKPIIYYKILTQQISSWKIPGKAQLYMSYLYGDLTKHFLTDPAPFMPWHIPECHGSIFYIYLVFIFNMVIYDDLVNSTPTSLPSSLFQHRLAGFWRIYTRMGYALSMEQIWTGFYMDMEVFWGSSISIIAVIRGVNFWQTWNTVQVFTETQIYENINKKSCPPCPPIISHLN